MADPTLEALRAGMPSHVWAHNRGRFIGSQPDSNDLAAATIVVGFDLRNATIQYRHTSRRPWKTGPNTLTNKVDRLRRFVEKDAQRVRENVAGLRRVTAGLGGLTLPARTIP